MKLFRKAKDERVVAEVNRVYKIGFYVLTFGILADLVLQMSGFDMQVDVLRGANPTSFNLLEFAILMLAQLVCIALMARKGLMDDNAYAEADRYPWKHYLVQVCWRVLPRLSSSARCSMVAARCGRPWGCAISFWWLPSSCCSWCP